MRTLIRAGLDETTAMEVSGDNARSMLLRRNIVTEHDTAEALLRADAYFSTPPASRKHACGSTAPRFSQGPLISSTPSQKGWESLSPPLFATGIGSAGGGFMRTRRCC